MTEPHSSARLRALPRYLFAELERKKAEALSAGREVLDLSIGDPDLPTPGPILDVLTEEARDPKNHRYPTSAGMPAARARIARWFEGRFGVRLDPEREIAILIGSKEGIGHFPLAVLDPGDEALVPDPGYPVYAAGTTFAGADPVRVPLFEEHGFVPRTSDLDRHATAKTRLLYVNYPNNPTGATAGAEAYRDLAAWAKKRDLLLAADAAYSELYYDEPPVSILAAPDARERAVEFHSFSKTFNMTGWRIGFAAGAAPLIDALVRLKANFDSGAPQAIQVAATRGLESLQEHGPALRAVYRERRDVVVDALTRASCSVFRPGGAFFVWARVPDGERSIAFAERLFQETGVLVTPGVGFGAGGDRHFRVALTVAVETLRRALDRVHDLAPWKARHASASSDTR